MTSKSKLILCSILSCLAGAWSFFLAKLAKRNWDILLEGKPRPNLTELAIDYGFFVLLVIGVLTLMMAFVEKFKLPYIKSADQAFVMITFIVFYLCFLGLSYLWPVIRFYEPGAM